MPSVIGSQINDDAKLIPITVRDIAQKAIFILGKIMEIFFFVMISESARFAIF
jgi:hypothetical protein